MGKMTYEELMMQYITYTRLKDTGSIVELMYYPHAGGGRDG